MERSDQSFEPSTPVSTHLSERAALHLAPFGPDGPPPEAIAALRAHPRFAEAWRTAHIGFIDLWQGNRMLNSLVNDRGRLLISLFAVHLHLLSRPNDPHSGLTVSRMTTLCAEQNFCSPGRAKAMLMLMRVFGYLAPSPNEADRRLRRLVPTEHLMSLHRERNRRLFRADRHGAARVCRGLGGSIPSGLYGALCMPVLRTVSHRLPLHRSASRTCGSSSTTTPAS